MKTKLFTIAAIALAVTAQQASAADGTINFSGEIIAETCTVKVNNNPSPSTATVTLPTVSSATLQSPGQTTARTRFNIQLSGCTGTAISASAFFEASQSVDPISGLLLNTGTAQNVRLELLDGVTGMPIEAGQSGQITDTTRNTIEADGTANMAYDVQYKSIGAATAGTVLSSVTYSVNYQ